MSEFEYYTCEEHVGSEVEDTECSSLTLVTRIGGAKFVPCGLQLLRGRYVLYQDACKRKASWVQKSRIPVFSKLALCSKLDLK